MLEQYILPILFLVILEGLLSFDNALALAAMVKHLPEQQRKKALTYGIVGAFVFRAIALLFLVHIMESTWVKIVGGGYLVWLSLSYFWSTLRETTGKIAEATHVASRTFWMTVILVEMTDIAFSVDSILAAVAVSDKLWVVALGGVLGIIMMRFAATVFVKLIDRFPRLETTAFILVGIVGVKMLLKAFAVVDFHQALPQTVFWMSMVTGLSYGFTKKIKKNISIRN